MGFFDSLFWSHTRGSLSSYEAVFLKADLLTLVCPSAGQAFLIKLRPTKERTIESLALELPYNVALPSSNSSSSRRGRPRWRHMKHACGENIRRVYSQTRLDLAWNFRDAYAEATKLKRAQDRFCERALEVHAKGTYLRHDSSSASVAEFPDDLKQEALVDVLRGKVKVRFASAPSE